MSRRVKKNLGAALRVPTSTRRKAVRKERQALAD